MDEMMIARRDVFEVSIIVGGREMIIQSGA
jgi:hypothetical protein